MGKEQSPIDLNTDISLLNPLDKSLQFDYHNTDIICKDVNYNLSFLVDSNECKINWEHRQFQLKEFHFHSLAEHYINGKQGDLECHLVHKDNNDNICVVGIIFVLNNQVQSFLKPLLENVPRKIEKYNINSFLPKENFFFHYRGSLTTKPFSENVLWFVFKDMVKINQQDLDFYTKHYKDNYRSLQPLGERKIYSI